VRSGREYEDSDAWHVQVLDDRVEQASSSFNSLIEDAKKVLSHYRNRRGDKVPSQLKMRVQLPLWLMEKDDGTMMGLSKKATALGEDPKSICPITRAGASHAGRKLISSSTPWSLS
jgi:hypothetical protein